MNDWLRAEDETAAAGEMLWGTLVKLINALAEERGRRHISREKERLAFLQILMDNGVLQNADARVFSPPGRNCITISIMAAWMRISRLRAWMRWNSSLSECSMRECRTIRAVRAGE